MSSVIADASPQQAHQTAIPQRRAALIAGLAYVLLTVLALFAIRVLDGSTQPDNPAATVEHIVNSKALFRSGLPAFFIVLIADVVWRGRSTSSSSEPAGSCRCSPPGSGCCMWPSPQPRS